MAPWVAYSTISESTINDKLPLHFLIFIHVGGFSHAFYLT